jgi:hypothetical protein
LGVQNEGGKMLESRLELESIRNLSNFNKNHSVLEVINSNKENKDSWLKRAFKEEWPTMANHLLSCGISIGAATGFSHYAPEVFESDAVISGIATALDTAGYWGAMIPQLMYRDRKNMKNEEGKLDGKKMIKKAGEYLGYIGIIEGIYVVGRFLGQYYLQKHGWNPDVASAAIQLGATPLFTFVMPPIRYAIRQWSER